MPLNKGATVFRSLLGDTPKIRVLEFLMKAREIDHSIGAIAKGAGINRVTLFRLWSEIEKSKLVTHTRNIGNAKLFAINKKNPYVANLLVLFDNLLKTPRMLSEATARSISYVQWQKRKSR